MATVKYNAKLGEYGYLGDLYTSIANLELTDHTKTKAVYEDSENGNKLVLLGKNFEYDGSDMEDGTITSLVFANDHDKRLATVLHGHWDPQALLTAYGFNGFEGMVNYVLKSKDTMIGTKLGDDLSSKNGNDKIDGREGNDHIDGGGGSDKLTGGKGSDEFYFLEAGTGHDVIVDFDAKGGGDKQDYLGIYPSHAFEEVHTKRGLMLEFDSGDTLLLLHVKALDETDFIQYA